jgi:SAM-dependent methyltransferase
MTAEDSSARPAIWDYYDRRAAEGVRGIGHACDYWAGLGVDVTEADIEAEAAQVCRHLRQLEPVSFVEVGAGPGTFTADLPGWGIALDQSDAALRVLLAGPARLPVVRADAFRLPLRDRAVGRVVAAHLYGLLAPADRQSLVAEGRRVAGELVILDAGRPDGVVAEHWQDRTLPSGAAYRVYRRHFDAHELAGELGGRAVFAGRFYVLIAA